MERASVLEFAGLKLYFYKKEKQGTMKNLLRLMTLAGFILAMASCSLLDVKVDTEFNGDLDIQVEEPVMKATDDTDFYAEKDINPRDDEDVNEYSDKIEEFDVTEVIATVLSVNKDGVIFREGTEFSIWNETHTATWTLGSDWSIEPGTEVTLDDLGDIYGTVADILGSLEVFWVSADGTCNETDVTIKLRIGISTTVIANPL